MNALILSIALTLFIFLFLIYSFLVSPMPLLYFIGIVILLVVLLVMFIFVGYSVFYIKNTLSKNPSCRYEVEDFFDELIDIIEKKQEKKKGKDL